MVLVENPIGQIRDTLEELGERVEQTVIRGPGGILSGPEGGRMSQYTLRPLGYQIKPEGDVSAGISVIEIRVEHGHLSPEQALIQLEGGAKLANDMLPLMGAMADGDVSAEEVAEVSAALPQLAGLRPGLKAGLVVVVEELRKDLADGKISLMEAAGSLLRVGRTMLGL